MAVSQHIIRLRNIDDISSMIECAAGVEDAIIRTLTSNDMILFDIDAPTDCSPAFLSVMNCLVARLHAQTIPFDTHNVPDWLVLSNVVYTYPTGIYGPYVMQSLSEVLSDRILLAGFANANSELIGEFIGLFAPLLTGMPNLFEEMESALAELMDNVFAHSESPEGGFLAGRHYAQQNMLRFAVCDLGISIPRHLRRMESVYVHQSDEFVLTEAFVLGVSGDKKTRFGSGLPTVSDMTIRLGGQLTAYSGNAIYEVKSGITKTLHVETRFPGTLISIEWPTTGD